MQGSGLVGQVPTALGLKCWSEDGNPASHGFETRTHSRKSMREWRNPGPRGLWARFPGGLGPAPTRGLGPFPQKPPKPLKLRFFAKPAGGSLAKAWVSAETAASEIGTWRETKPGYPPYPPFPICSGRKEGCSPSQQPSNTPPKVGGYSDPYFTPY